ncbi:MAG: DUF4381 domain-containing protein [Gammaproteobacteria bacterium]|nr:DUF4381 domain-containing protein [Gammaproteobacteria bacterium]
MSNPAQALENLRDIHLPTAVSAWPPGPAYYALIALSIVLILVLIQRKRHQQYTAPKREALIELLQIKSSYLKNPDSKPTAAAITALLKRVALVYHPRVDVASLYGEDWITFLHKTSKQIDFNHLRTSLLDTPFNPDSTEDLNPLLLAAHQWIKQRRKRCLN